MPLKPNEIGVVYRIRLRVNYWTSASHYILSRRVVHIYRENNKIIENFTQDGSPE